jgi:hypothetical protein
MPNNSGGNNAKLEALHKREAVLKAAIAIEKVRQQKKDEKDEARLHTIIGSTLVLNAAKHADFNLMLKGILKNSTSLSDSETKLLRGKGWI